MLSFHEFLTEAAEKGELVNVPFEERTFQLVGLIDRVVRPLEQAKGLSLSLLKNLQRIWELE